MKKKMDRNINVVECLLNQQENLDNFASTVTLLSLNDDCLLHLYEYLGLDEYLSLQRTCKRLQSITILAYKKLTDVTIGPETTERASIDFIFNHIGEYVQTLEVNFWRQKYVRNILRKFEAKCKKVKILTIKSLCETKDIPLPTCRYFHNIEMLTLNECSINSCISFFRCFRNLKSLNIYNCKSFGIVELASMLECNPHIESLVFWSDSTLAHSFNNSFKFPKLKKLSLSASLCDPEIYKHKVKKLSLHTFGNHSDELGKLNRNIEELELIIETRVKEHFFDRLKRFSKLRLLYIRTLIPVKLIMSLPKSKLKHLRLAGFEISSYSLISMIHQFDYVENIDLRDCYITQNHENYFKNIRKVAKEILKAMDLCQFQQKLNVILPLPCNYEDVGIEACSRKCVFDSNRLRILNNRFYACDENPLQIHIDFHTL